MSKKLEKIHLRTSKLLKSRNFKISKFCLETHGKSGKNLKIIFEIFDPGIEMHKYKMNKLFKAGCIEAQRYICTQTLRLSQKII